MNDLAAPPARPYLPTVLDAEAAPDDVAAWAARTTPGPVVVSALAALRPKRLSAAGRVDALAALERQIAWLQARQHELIAAMDAAASGQLDKDWLREDVAAALRLAPATAADRVDIARELTRLLGTQRLLEHGEITGLHARSLAEATRVLDHATAAAVEARVLPAAPGQSVGAFRRSVRRAVLAVDSRRAEERHAKAAELRRVVCTPQPDGMSAIWALLPDAGAESVMTSIYALAEKTDPADARTSDQRRADALVQLALDALTGTGGGQLPRRHGLRPAVNVTVALSTLLGLDEQPGELEGRGPIPAPLARLIASDETGTWRRLVTDEIGRLIEVGRRYRAPRNLAEHVIARDRTCRFPNCTRPARKCDLDHCQPWADGGATSADNLHALCPRHHTVKHEAGWTPRRREDGSTEWVGPTGHRYLVPAATYPIDRTADPPPF